MWNNHYFKVVIHPYMGHFDPFFTSILVYPGVVPERCSLILKPIPVKHQEQRKPLQPWQPPKDRGDLLSGSLT